VSGRTLRIARETVILILAGLWGTYEIGFGGARESVLILIGGMVAAAAGLRIDDAIREKRRDPVD